MNNKYFKLQYEIGNRLLNRLQYFNININKILILGNNIDNFNLVLKKYYPYANIVNFNIFNKELYSMEQRKYNRDIQIINKKIILPFDNNIFDLVISNQIYCKFTSILSLIKEIYRITNNNGILLFSTYGTKTLKEFQVQTNFSKIVENIFFNMHDIGNFILFSRFKHSVVDTEFMILYFYQFNQFLRYLKIQGIYDYINQYRDMIHSAISIQKKIYEYKTLLKQNKKFPITYEIIYGNAWKY